MVCACPYHVGFRWLLQAWNKMVAQADGDDDMQPLTREDCLARSVCGGDFERAQFDCIEGRCGQCKLRTMRSPVHVDAAEKVAFNAFGYETYTTKKGVEAKRRVQIQRSLSATDFVTYFNVQLGIFKDHHYKSVFLAQQRSNMWKTCPSDWIIMSIDWNSNYERKQNTTLTCQTTRSAILCPIVLQRCIDPFTDPLVGQHHAVQHLINKKGLKPGDVLRILEAHIFVSSTTDQKGPATTTFMVNTILDFHKEHGVPQPKCIVMDTDNCSAQFKSAVAVMSMTELGKRNNVNTQAFQNVGNHGKGFSDGVGAACKRVFDAACIGINLMVCGGLPQKEFGAALVAVGNKMFQPVEGVRTGRLVVRKFWNIATAPTTDLAGKFRPQKDGMGNTRGMTTIHNFLYDHASGRTLFRNLLCACSPCLAGLYDKCENKACVAPPVEFKIAGCSAMDCDTQSDCDEHSDSACASDSDDDPDGSDVGSEDSFVESACKGLTIDLSLCDLFFDD